MTNRVKLNVSNLKSAVAKARLKKMDLAVDIGVSRETFSRWLAGKVDYIEESKVRRLSTLLGCELSWLSPEIPAEVMPPSQPLNPAERIRGDDFLRLGLYSGLWREVALLYKTSVHPDVLEHGHVNRSLCEAMQALMEMNGSGVEGWSRPLDPAHKNYELFEVIAKANLCEALGLLWKNRLDDGHRLLKRVVVQGQSEWVVSLAYLLSGLCYMLQSRRKEAHETWNRGLQSFPHSSDDLTLFIQANLGLAICLEGLDVDPQQSAGQLARARTLMESIGYRLGYARCLAYEALLLSLQEKKADSIAKCQELSGFIHKMPRLYQFESYLLLARTHALHTNQEAALQYLEMASELAHGSPFFENILRTMQQGGK
ncbi:MAG TPA: helix-turn-helix transcriptional regulator [Oligoflexus sp.]|uniref:helix-turn-helix domain-containing protein n=1 Tax=Oligoflexus sp. TaxID=1971216 RepID=UPI002D8084C2|nr:helix-turn-helix transcriptional regulator [Oligoflexus sp.]HET9238974.1 helix-turn-helix transcriptional regulator [Oligoflexus sp.]